MFVSIYDIVHKLHNQIILITTFLINSNYICMEMHCTANEIFVCLKA